MATQTLKNNLNLQIEERENLLKNPRIGNDLLDKTFQTAVLTSSAVSRLAVFLTEEELAQSGATIMRYEIEKEIFHYTFVARQYYRLAVGVESLADWLLQQGTNDEFFADFFLNLVNETDLQERVFAEIGVSYSDIVNKKVAREDARADEQLEAEARNKVEQALDLKNLLTASLRAFGYAEREVVELCG